MVPACASLLPLNFCLVHCLRFLCLDDLQVQGLDLEILEQATFSHNSILSGTFLLYSFPAGK